MRSIIWWQALLFFALGALLGQRFVHMHPMPTVKDANA